MPSDAPCFATRSTLYALQSSTTGQTAERPILPSTTRIQASPGFPALLMVEWQITRYIERKLARKNKKRAFRSPRQQREVAAIKLNDAKLIEGMDTYPTEGKYSDLIYGRYEKTIFVMEIVKRRIEAKTKNPESCGQRKSPQGQHTAAIIRYIWRRDNRADSALTKVSAPNQWIPIETKKEKNPNHILMSADLKVQSQRQNLKKK